MRQIPTGPMTGLIALLVLLGFLDAAVGLGTAGWVAGLGAGVVTAAALTLGLLRRSSSSAGVALGSTRRARLGPADRVTLTRAVLVCGVAALVADSFARPTPLPSSLPSLIPILVALSAAALVLDGVDGVVARRTGTASPLGARFDLEVDAFLILVLSVQVGHLLGWWVLALGAARYALGAAAWVAPWLRRQLPARRWRKVVAAVQGIVLTVAAAQVLPSPWTAGALVVALALLVVSFGTEVRDLWRIHTRETDRARGHSFVTVLAGVLVWSALVAPATLTGLTPAAFVRIPVEGLLVVALVLVLRGRAQHWLAALAGLVLGVLVLVRVLDLGFRSALYRPFNPVTDWRYVGSAKDLLGDAIGPVQATLAVGAAGLLALGLVVMLALSFRRLARVVDRHRGRSTRAVAVLAAAWVVCAASGLHLVPGLPIASSTSAWLAYTEASQVRANLQDRQVFAQALAVDPLRDIPGSDLLTALRGKDVIITVVESYGQVAVQGSPQVAAALDAGTSQLHASGFESRSAWLASPTFGGISWLAHSTLQSGLWVDSQQRYDQLVATDHSTLSDAFRRAGWRTVSVDPANRRDWPEGSTFYHYDQLYDARNVGYAGPSFGYGPVPDQYTLAAFDRLELGRPGRPPVMAEINLVSSHVPWAPLPHLVDWSSIGNGSIFATMHAQATPRDVVWRTAAGVREAYDQSIAYSLGSIVSFVQHSHDDNLVLVVLGDHQPATVVSGPGASHDVPISIVAHDPAVLDRIAAWGWHDGLRPTPDAPSWPMDQFRDRFLAAYGAGPGAGPGQGASPAAYGTSVK